MNPPINVPINRVYMCSLSKMTKKQRFSKSKSGRKRPRGFDYKDVNYNDTSSPTRGREESRPNLPVLAEIDNLLANPTRKKRTQHSVAGSSVGHFQQVTPTIIKTSKAELTMGRKRKRGF